MSFDLVTETLTYLFTLESRRIFVFEANFNLISSHFQSMCFPDEYTFIFTLVFIGWFWGGTLMSVCRAYFWFCAQQSFLELLKAVCGLPNWKQKQASMHARQVPDSLHPLCNPIPHNPIREQKDSMVMVDWTSLTQSWDLVWQYPSSPHFLWEPHSCLCRSDPPLVLILLFFL